MCLASWSQRLPPVSIVPYTCFGRIPTLGTASVRQVGQVSYSESMDQRAPLDMDISHHRDRHNSTERVDDHY